MKEKDLVIANGNTAFANQQGVIISIKDEIADVLFVDGISEISLSNLTIVENAHNNKS